MSCARGPWRHNPCALTLATHAGFYSNISTQRLMGDIIRLKRGPDKLPTEEFDLLITFVENKGIVLKREQLLRLAWGYDYYGETRTVDVHVAQLRKKLADSSVKIETLTGVGYKLVA